MTPAVEFRGVSRTFGATRAVDDLSLTIAPGEFFSLLGPSGCGKTTTLRLLAGFEVPDAGGTILIDGVDVTGKRPYERNLSMVFQSYALFPFVFNFGAVIAVAAFMLTYLTYAPEPVTLSAKLVGLSLVSILLILGFAGVWIYDTTPGIKEHLLCFFRIPPISFTP